MSFENNVITNAGKSLIAAATAADPIVFVGFVGSTTALSEQQLRVATLSDFDITGGTIGSASAQGTVARITGRITNQSSVVIAKSFAVVARRESESDVDNIILAGISDSNANIRIPSTSEPPVSISIPINIAIDTEDNIQIVTGSAASPSDLTRFVSMYKAGNPSEGDNQSIKGTKSFETIDVNSLSANDEFLIGTDCTINIGSHVDLLSDLEFVDESDYSRRPLYIGYDAYGGYIGSNATSFSTYSKDSSTNTRCCVMRYDVLQDYVSNPYGEITFYANSRYWEEDTFVTLRASHEGNSGQIPGELEVRADVKLNNSNVTPTIDNFIDIGTSSERFSNVYSVNFHGDVNGDLNGRIPRPVNSAVINDRVPIGAIVLCYIASAANLTHLYVGETFTITSPSFEYSIAQNSYGSSFTSSRELGVGTYMALSELVAYPTPGSTEGVVLVMRIS